MNDDGMLVDVTWEGRVLGGEYWRTEYGLMECGRIGEDRMCECEIRED